jgi:hypothetical protein
MLNVFSDPLPNFFNKFGRVLYIFWLLIPYPINSLLTLSPIPQVALHSLEVLKFDVAPLPSCFWCHIQETIDISNVLKLPPFFFS